MKINKVISDVFYNVVAAAAPLLVLQLIVFPNVAKTIDQNIYGLMLTVYTLFNIIPGTVGATLNNIRLLHQNQYDDKENLGDFQILTLLGSIFIIIGVIIGAKIVEENITIISLIQIVLISLLILLHDYWLVIFRINLNYKYILYDRIFISFGFGIGFLLFYFSNNWYYIFLVGYLSGLIFIIFNSNIWKEPFSATINFKFILNESVLFMISVFLLRLTSYADKLLLYPILGGTAVSVYNAATSLSKLVSLAINPINGVMLTYLSKMNTRPVKLFVNVLFLTSIISIIGFFASIFVSKILLQLIYPMFAAEASKYIIVTSGITVFNVAASIVQPFVLKFASMKFQIIINSIDVFLYTLISLVLLSYYGLIGFSIGVLISRVIKVAVLIIVYFKVDTVSIE